MAIDYVNLPWLRPANTADQYMRGFQSAASVQEAQDRLAQQERMSMMDFAARQAQQQWQNQRQQQQLAIDQAYNQAQLNLSKGRLTTLQASAQRQAQQAAQMYQAQQAYQSEIAGGADPIDALIRYGPSMKMPMTGMAQLIKEARTQDAEPDQPYVFDQGGMKGVMVPKGWGFHAEKTEKEMNEAQRESHITSVTSALDRQSQQMEKLQAQSFGDLESASPVGVDGKPLTGIMLQRWKSAKSAYDALKDSRTRLQKILDKLEGSTADTGEGDMGEPTDTDRQGELDQLRSMDTGNPIRRIVAHTGGAAAPAVAAPPVSPMAQGVNPFGMAGGAPPAPNIPQLSANAPPTAGQSSPVPAVPQPMAAPAASAPAPAAPAAPPRQERAVKAEQIKVPKENNALADYSRGRVATANAQAVASMSQRELSQAAKEVGLKLEPGPEGSFFEARQSGTTDYSRKKAIQMVLDAASEQEKVFRFGQ